MDVPTSKSVSGTGISGDTEAAFIPLAALNFMSAPYGIVTDAPLNASV